MTMLITHEREKLLNAIVYFVANTKYCGTTKLFKLLNFLDFEHYKQTGRSVTGLDYSAWDYGPVPTDLFFEIKDDPKSDLVSTVSFEERIKEENDSKRPTKIRARQKFESKYFTKRELKILECLAYIYIDATADEMTRISHANDLPWKKTITAKGKKQCIDYCLVLEEKKLPRPKEVIEDLNSEYEETKALLQ